MSHQLLLRVSRAAVLLDVSPDALRKRIQRAAQIDSDGVARARLDGGITAVKLHGAWRVHVPDLDSLLATSAEGAAP
ncbi:MAG TPA: hypothetical protein PLU22_20850 [Polyangiaceae bacterium]|nr:hypothetical protein [Polyangiaceae bacterium]